MNTRHFLKKGDRDNEEIYQIFGSCFDSKRNQHETSSSSQSPTLESAENQQPEYKKILSNATATNPLTKSSIDNKEKDDDSDETRFCHFILSSNVRQKDKDMKEIKVDFFQFARLSKKFQKMKQFYNFPFIKKIKLDIKDINEDTFLEFIKSTQGKEFKITEANYLGLRYLSNEWETKELTNILEDYGKRHESEIVYIIQEYIELTKEYDDQKEEDIELKKLRRKDEGKMIKENLTTNLKKINFGQIKAIEKKMKNRIGECLKTNSFWRIRTETIHRLINETSKPDYSHDLLLKYIIGSINERKMLIEFIDPCKITEDNRKILVDIQYDLIEKCNINGQDIRKNNLNCFNMNLFFELLKSHRESNYCSNINSTDKNKEIIWLKRELEQKENQIEQKGKEMKELREREILICNELSNIKVRIKKEREEVQRKSRELKIREIKIRRSLEELNNKEKANNIREEKNKLNEGKIEMRLKEVEIRENDIQRREKEIEEKTKSIENREKDINSIEKEIEITKEENARKERQKQILINELVTGTEIESFLKENYLKAIDENNGIHIACENGNLKIVSYILSRNPNKLNARDVLF